MRYKVTATIEFHTDSIDEVNARLELLQQLYKLKLKNSQTIKLIKSKMEKLIF